MLARPINSILKKHFQELYKSAHEKADALFKSKVEARLKDLDHFNKLKFLASESNRLEHETCNNLHPYYIENYANKECLLDQFAGRKFVLGVDESVELSECIFHGKYERSVNEFRRSLERSTPPYTWMDFISGKIDPYFAEFDRRYGVKEEDYYQIRIWQAQNLIKVISYESQMLIDKIQKHCTKLKDPLAFLIGEKDKIEIELYAAKGNAKKIKSTLSQLFAFDNQFLNFDNALIIECFDFYISRKIHWKYAFPLYLNPLVEKVDQKVKNVFSNETTIFFTINKIEEWIDSVIKGRPLQKPVEEADWEMLYKKVRKDASKKVNTLKMQINGFVEKPKLSMAEKKEYLHAQFDIYLKKFSQFENKNVFIPLKLEDNKILKDAILKNAFMTKSFFGNRIKEESNDLIEAIVIQEVSFEIFRLYLKFFKRYKLDLPDEEYDHLDIVELQNKMVIDKELYDEMREGMKDFFTGMNYPLHFEFILQNHRKQFANLFHKSLSRLQERLDDADPTKKILFLQSRLKELRHDEIHYNELTKTESFFLKEFHYVRLFKKFIEIEADFIRETKDVQLSDDWLSRKNIKRFDDKVQTFDDALPKVKRDFILKMLEDVGITTNGKSQLGPKGAYQIRAVVEAAIAKNILPKRILYYTKLIGDKINHPIASKLGQSKYFDSVFKRYKTYIDAYYKPTLTD